MPLTYTAPIYFTPIPAAGKHIHTKLLKMRWNQDFKGKDFGYQIGLSTAHGTQAKKSPFSKRCFIILAPGEGKWKQVAEKEQSQGLSAQSANPNKSWERYISKASLGGKWWVMLWMEMERTGISSLECFLTHLIQLDVLNDLQGTGIYPSNSSYV